MKEMEEIEVWKAHMLWWGVLIACTLLLTCSCTSTKYVPVETVRTETKYKDRLVRDSIHVKDSVTMFMKGDTIFRDRWHSEYKDRLVRDTVNLTDSIRIEAPYPVEKELSKWQSFKIDIGGIAIGGVTVLLIIIIGWLMFRKRNK